MTSTYWLGVLFAGVVLVAIFLRMRNSGMKEHYATWWIVIAVGSILGSIFPRAFKAVSTALGVQVPLNLAFFVAGIALLLLSLRFSVDLSQSSEDRRRLTEEIAILRAEVEALQARAGGSPSSDPGSPGAGEEDASKEDGEDTGNDGGR